jgi:hypothetical protein
LQNSEFKNIFIIGGDIYPTSYTFAAVNIQVNLIAVNLYKLLKNYGNGCNLNELKLYDGETEFILWISKI